MKNATNSSSFISYGLLWLPKKEPTSPCSERPPDISSVDAAAFRAWYLSEEVGDQKERATTLLSTGHNLYRLACTCIELPSGNYPSMTIISPVLRPDSQGKDKVFRPMTVRRMGRPNEHLVSCCLSRPLRRSDCSKRIQRDPDIDDRSATTFLYGTPTDISERIPPEQIGDPTGEIEQLEHPGRPTLCSLLMHLIHKGGLNILGRSLDIDEIRTAIESVSKKIVRKNSGLSLCDLLEVFPDQLEESPARLIETIAKKNKMPTNELKIAYVIALAETIEIHNGSSATVSYCNPHVLSCSNDRQMKLGLVSRVKVKVPMTVTHAMGHQVCGPYLVILKAAQKPGIGSVWTRGFACSILDVENPIPVAADLERLGIRNYVLPVLSAMKRMGIDIKIWRPVKNIEVPSGETCFPDLVGEIDGGRSRSDRRIVEMGNIDTDEYKNSKSVTHPRMKEHAPLIVLTGACNVNSAALEMFLQWFIKPDESDDRCISTD